MKGKKEKKKKKKNHFCMLTSTSKTYIQKKSPETEWHQKW